MGRKTDDTIVIREGKMLRKGSWIHFIQTKRFLSLSGVLCASNFARCCGSCENEQAIAFALMELAV